MKIRWSERSLNDIDEISNYIRDANPPAAQRVLVRILEAVDSLAGAPQRGRPGRWPGTRELIVTGSPYIVPYRVVDGTIEVLRVYHAARRWPDPP